MEGIIAIVDIKCFDNGSGDIVWVREGWFGKRKVVWGKGGLFEECFWMQGGLCTGCCGADEGCREGGKAGSCGKGGLGKGRFCGGRVVCLKSVVDWMRGAGKTGSCGKGNE